jgi:hypothetical protein
MAAPSRPLLVVTVNSPARPRTGPGDDLDSCFHAQGDLQLVRVGAPAEAASLACGGPAWQASAIWLISRSVRARRWARRLAHSRTGGGQAD